MMRSRRAWLVGVVSAISCTSPQGKPPPSPPSTAPDLGVPGIDVKVSVLGHHRNPTKDGLYVDPALTRAAARRVHRDTAFDGRVQGDVYAQPLYVAGGARDLVMAVTEQDWVHAFDARTGAVVWQRQLGAPAPLGRIRCGIAPLGITGTPVIDAASRTMFLDAVITPDGVSRKHLLFAVSVDDGAVRPGWPVDVAATVQAGPVHFDPEVQNQRGGLLILNGVLYVTYGALPNDCGDYRGWVVAVPIADPAHPRGWATPAAGSGIWAPAGPTTDGQSIYVATGNGGDNGAGAWAGSEAVLRLSPAPAFSSAAADYFAPPNWQTLDAKDQDLGGSGALIFRAPGATPEALAIALGKNGWAYLLDRARLGGIGGSLDSKQVSGGEIISAPVAYTTAQGTYVVFQGTGLGCPTGQYGNLTALRIIPTAPPRLSIAWCADQHGRGSPIVTTTDGQAEAVVWSVGAEGESRLCAVDGDTGEVLFGGGGADDVLAKVQHFQVPIAARGRIYVAGDERVYAFTPQ